MRYCADCDGCRLITTVQGNTLHICLDETGGAFLQEVGLCGWCNSGSELSDEAEESI